MTRRKLLTLITTAVATVASALPWHLTFAVVVTVRFTT